MAWFTLDEARAACGESAGAADVLAWLDGLDAVVCTGRTPTVVRLYSRKGFSLLQEVVTETREVRGLAHGLAVFLSDGLRSDNTRTHDYYALHTATRSGNAWTGIEASEVSVTAGPPATDQTYVTFNPGGLAYAVKRKFNLPTEGRAVAAEARRANEADGWTVAMTETAYGVPYTEDARNVFTPGMPDIMSGIGHVVSKSSSRTFVFSFAGAVLYQTETTTVTEYQYLTQAEADQKVADNTADASYVRVSKSSGGITVYRDVKSGTQKTASSRYVDAENGFTVSVTAIDYGHTGW